MRKVEYWKSKRVVYKSIFKEKWIGRANLICIMFFIAFVLSCSPKAPEPPRLYSIEDLKYHPKDANGIPEGYQVVYSRTGVNSVDYIKKTDLEKFNKEHQAYEDYQKQKVLKKEYGTDSSKKWYEKEGNWIALIIFFVIVYFISKDD